jgi:hypothetical protein
MAWTKITRPKYERKAARYQTDVSDADSFNQNLKFRGRSALVPLPGQRRLKSD